MAIANQNETTRRRKAEPDLFVLASDFDQTLSFNDSGYVLAEILGVTNFKQKIRGLAQSNLVHAGGELAYLIRHDPEFRGVRREHLVEAGKRVRLKQAIPEMVEFLEQGVDDYRFWFCIVSAAPREIVVSALDGIVPAERIFATELNFDDVSGEVCAIQRAAAGFGKVAIIDDLVKRFAVPLERIIYVGDGASDIHVMLHVNNGGGYTVAVSENKQLARIAKSTVLSDNALSFLAPMLGQVFGWHPTRIEAAIQSKGWFTPRTGEQQD